MPSPTPRPNLRACGMPASSRYLRTMPAPQLGVKIPKYSIGGWAIWKYFSGYYPAIFHQALLTVQAIEGLPNVPLMVRAPWVAVRPLHVLIPVYGSVRCVHLSYSPVNCVSECPYPALHAGIQRVRNLVQDHEPGCQYSPAAWAEILRLWCYIYPLHLAPPLLGQFGPLKV